MKFLILVVAILGAASAGAPENRDKRGLISSLGYGWDHSLALHAPSWSHSVAAPIVAAPIVAAPTVVKTISHAPIIRTIVAPQPIIKTVVSAPHIYSYAPAPVISYGHSLSSLPLGYKWTGHYPLSHYSW
ncbi:hypothetical protein WA026_006401 [Henosepilachna vigintioctopunctata]|uniref:Uncharacterized protein n=1 Tax=Henosepilachna vigintioctopunctata TaxID=420089 RepID=A0AAW1TNR6_9CUCU